MPTGPLNRETVEAALANLADPESGRTLARMEQIREIAVQPGRVDVELALTNWARPLWDDVRQEAESLLRAALPADTQIEIRVTEHPRLPEKIGQIGLAAKSVIAVGSATACESRICANHAANCFNGSRSTDDSSSGSPA